METDKISRPELADRPYTPAGAPTTGSSKLGKDEFVKLLLTQLRSQDPTSPMDSHAFVSQLAQFGSVSGIQSMQKSIESLSSSLRSTQMMNGTTIAP